MKKWNQLADQLLACLFIDKCVNIKADISTNGMAGISCTVDKKKFKKLKLLLMKTVRRLETI